MILVKGSSVGQAVDITSPDAITRYCFRACIDAVRMGNSDRAFSFAFVLAHHVNALERERHMIGINVHAGEN